MDYIRSKDEIDNQEDLDNQKKSEKEGIVMWLYVTSLTI